MIRLQEPGECENGKNACLGLTLIFQCFSVCLEGVLYTSAVILINLDSVCGSFGVYSTSFDITSGYCWYL